MRTCKACGNRGLFVKINSEGRCRSCEKEYQNKMKWDREVKQEALRQSLLKQRQLEQESLRQPSYDYYNKIASMLSEISSEIETSDDPMKRLGDLPLFMEKINFCDSLVDLISKNADFEYFPAIVQEKIIYESDNDRRIHFGRIPEFGISVWTNRDNYISDIIDSIQASAERYKRGWQIAISRIKSDAEFQRGLEAIKNAPIEVSSSASKKFKVTDISDLKLSNITSKTNYEKTGTFIAIDTETTGLNCGHDEIIEVAAILFENWIPKLKFETLLKPSSPISSQIVGLTGITNDMVENAPRFGQISDCLLDFISSYNLVGHNLKFDLKFLYKNGLDFYSQKRKYFDTLSISQKMLKKPVYKYNKEFGYYDIDYDKEYDVEDHKLDTLCDYYSIRDNSMSHRALSDAYATGILFKKLVREKIL